MNEINKNTIVKNIIEQIQKEKQIQLCTKDEIFSFNVNNGIILSFRELFSFYSFRNIFNKNEETIDYTNYSEIKFKLNDIEKDLANIILTGKKLFSKEQKTYEFYLDNLEQEEITKKFEKFTEIYGKNNLTDEDKLELKKQISNLKKIILYNLETLIYYLIQDNNFEGNKKIAEIDIKNLNLYLDNQFIQMLEDLKNIMINQLVSMYEFIEEEIWEFISQRYVNQVFNNPYDERIKLDEFYDNESNRELKNDMLTSLLIKLVCRTLPNEQPESQSRNLFVVLKEKNMNLPKKILDELDNLKNSLGALLSNAIDITFYFVSQRNYQANENNRNVENRDDELENQDNENEEKNDDGEEEDEDDGRIM